MRIAQISPLYESVPPRLYGGTERVVANLTEALIDRGHDVTLFASGDSMTRADLVPCVPTGLRLDTRSRDPLPSHVSMIDQVVARAGRFDILHFHIDFLQFPLARLLDVPVLTTLHGRLDLPDIAPFYRSVVKAPLVSISNSQRSPMPPVTWAGTVYHGLPKDLLPFSPEAKGGYLAFLGRISPEKRPDRAIEIAVRAGMPLKIAAKIEAAVDLDYWRDRIAPMVSAHPGIEFVGEIDELEKARFLGDAAALLFPIDWPEPFGLVMIEAMSCGTPVIAWPLGSVPEIVNPGVSGWIVDSVDAAVDAVALARSMDRRKVRSDFESRFTSDRMARDYLAIYSRLVGSSPGRPRGLRPTAESVNLGS